MKVIRSFLLSCFVYHASAFVISPATRQGVHHTDSALNQHSWHDSDFYNSQNDRTRRPLHDKGRDNAAYPDFQEHFSASIYRRPGMQFSTYSPPATSRPYAQPYVPPRQAYVPPPQPTQRYQPTSATTQPYMPPQTATQPYYYAPPQTRTQTYVPPSVSHLQPPAPQPVAQPAPAYAAAPVSTREEQDPILKRLESLEKNVEEINMTLNYIAEMLEKSLKDK